MPCSTTIFSHYSDVPNLSGVQKVFVVVTLYIDLLSLYLVLMSSVDCLVTALSSLSCKIISWNSSSYVLSSFRLLKIASAIAIALYSMMCPYGKSAKFILVLRMELS